MEVISLLLTFAIKVLKDEIASRYWNWQLTADTCFDGKSDVVQSNSRNHWREKTGPLPTGLIIRLLQHLIEICLQIHIKTRWTTVPVECKQCISKCSIYQEQSLKSTPLSVHWKKENGGWRIERMKMRMEAVCQSDDSSKYTCRPCI